MVESSDEKFEITEEDNAYVKEIITGIQSNESSIDEKIKKYLKDWSFERISKIDLAILRLAKEEARNLNCATVGSEMILLGILSLIA